jgi:hypothetical protein
MWQPQFTLRHHLVRSMLSRMHDTRFLSSFCFFQSLMLGCALARGHPGRGAIGSVPRGGARACVGR